MDMQATMTTARARECALDQHSNYAGKVFIWAEYSFYQGTHNAPTDGYVRDHPFSDDPAVFESVREAHEWIRGATAGVYFLRNGEYDSPMHYVVPAA
jgi:hypothetical protein